MNCWTLCSGLTSETCCFKTFVANRVAIFRDSTRSTQWRYVSSTLNPADTQTNCREHLEEPRLDLCTVFLTPEEEQEQWTLRQVQPDDIEQRKSVRVNVNLTHKTESLLSKMVQYYTKWYRLKKAVAWLIQIKTILVQLSKKQELKSMIGQMTTDAAKMKDAVHQIITDYKKRT